MKSGGGIMPSNKDCSHLASRDPFRQSTVRLLILLSHGEDDDEVVELRHAVDVTHAGVVQDLSLSVESTSASGVVEVTLSIIGPEYSSQLPIHSKVIISISGDDDDLATVFSPPNPVPAHHHLHNNSKF